MLLEVWTDKYPIGGIAGFGMPESSLPLLEKLVVEVNRVRHERYGLGPVQA